MAVMRHESERELDLLKENFKMLLVAAHPNGVKIVREMDQDPNEWAEPVEEGAPVEPLAGDQIEKALKDLSRLGFAIVDD